MAPLAVLWAPAEQGPQPGRRTTKEGGRSHTTPIWAVPALLALLALALTGCSQSKPVEPGVLASVGDTAITVSEVVALLSSPEAHTPVLLAGQATPDPWRAALQEVTRAELFAKEATERRLPLAPGPVNRATRARSLIDDEVGRLASSDAWAVSDTEARDWYEVNRARFEELEGFTASWARLRDLDSALALLDEAVGLNAEDFLSLVGQPGPHFLESGQARYDLERADVDVVLEQVAYALRRPGVGLAQGDDGQWWLVRIDDLTFVPAPWTPALAHRTRSVMQWEREQEHLGRIAKSLERKWPVRVFEAELAAARS